MTAPVSISSAGAPPRWSAAPTEADWAALVAALTAGDPVLLLAHVAPDADALGSATAIGLALASRGLPVQVSYGDDPFVLPRVLRTLPGQELLVPPAEVVPAAVAVSFDVSSQARLGVLSAAYDAAPLRVAIDHHVSYTGFGGLSLVDVRVPATAVLALELVDRLGVPLSAPIAANLYAGLLTDTGSFKYAATDPAAHRMAARLLETGIEHDRIARLMYDDDPFAAITLLGRALAHAQLYPSRAGGRGVALTWVSREDRGELPIDALERVIDVLRCTTEAQVAVVLKQEDTGAWRVSMRSKGAVDLSEVAERLGGGGHRYAAGCTDPSHDLAEVTERVLAGLG